MVLSIPVSLDAQPVQPRIAEDSVAIIDSLTQIADTIVIDSAAISKNNNKKQILEAEVKYSSEDSLSISLGQQRVYLYDKATVNYQDIALKADYIEFDYASKIVMATGVIDSSGQIAGKPEFAKGEEIFNSDTIEYNFDTHKGLIKYIITQQGEGYLHSTRTKRLEDGEIHISKGKYTTCDAVHPHFYIALTKAISIPNKRIVSGPAYLVFEDIPVPLALPFGFFPNSNKRSSGLIIPDFRDEQRRGFGLEEGGWYFAFNDYIDIAVLGSIYSRGSWGVNATSAYLVKYRYSGNFRMEYFNTQIKDDPTSQQQKDFSIKWSHSQDTKANPTRKFSAQVNFSSVSYDKNQGNNFENILTNQKNSSIQYTKTWPGSPFNFSANLNHYQNSRNHSVDLTLPSMSFNMNRIYPLRSKNPKTKYNWFENIQISYSAKLENKISSTDSTLFTNRTLKNMENGFSHSIPINLANFKLLKFINISPSVSYNGVLYSKYIQKSYLADTAIYGNKLVIDTINKVTYAHALSTALSISVNPVLYGMFESTRPNSYIIAIRHVMKPSASFSFSPDMSGLMPNYYRKLAYPHSITQPVQYPSEYSVYEGQLYGTPTVNGRSGSLSLSLNNNLEMKVRSKNDTTGEGKKVSILDNLNFSSGYNPFASSYKWSVVTMSGNTTLFNKKVNLSVRSVFDPYALDSTGKKKIDKYLINEKGKLFRMTSASIDIGFRLQSAAGDKKGGSADKKEADRNAEELNPTMDILDEASQSNSNEYVNFNIPWSINVNYSWSLSRPLNVTSYVHTVRISGDLNITPKWKIGMNLSYDFVSNKLTATNFNIHRDLHCWEMRFSIVPIGTYKSYSFTISAKSSLLHDLKWNKRKSWWDNI